MSMQVMSQINKASTLFFYVDIPTLQKISIFIHKYSSKQAYQASKLSKNCIFMAIYSFYNKISLISELYTKNKSKRLIFNLYAPLKMTKMLKIVIFSLARHKNCTQNAPKYLLTKAIKIVMFPRVDFSENSFITPLLCILLLGKKSGGVCLGHFLLFMLKDSLILLKNHPRKWGKSLRKFKMPNFFNFFA